MSEATYPGVRFRSYNRLIKIEQEGTVNVCVEEAMAQAYGVPLQMIREANKQTRALHSKVTAPQEHSVGNGK